MFTNQGSRDYTLHHWLQSLQKEDVILFHRRRKPQSPFYDGIQKEGEKKSLSYQSAKYRDILTLGALIGKEK